MTLSLRHFLLVGLGNPGQEYEHTRHNVGFLALDQLQKDWQTDEFKENKKLNAFVSNYQLSTVNCKLCKPITFMNLSGKAVRKTLTYYKINPDSLIVLHDDIDLPLGQIRIVQNSSDGGHNGVQNIIDKLGTQNFIRVKIGIGPKPHPEMDAADFVLGKFTKEEQKKLQPILSQMPDIIKGIITEGVEKAQNKYN
ncbi:aminoacyl-tRNA hydrolase [Candidatus Peregrinibacteria bacterium CG1_02_41_10]|nr:MAG: aminoacyl-tRNA hydrolase [Candidatus Peregrinibacteria bacterium CG1_02_41_10]